MQIKFYNWTGAPNVLHKTLPTQPNLTLGGTLREQCSIEAPSILIQANPIGQNYVHIPEFSRYYFITDVVAVRNGAFRVELRVDVLQTYHAQIKNCPCVPIRSSDQYNSWIYDTQIPFEEAATSYSLPPVGQAGVDYAVWDYDNMSLIVGAIGASVWEAV